MYFNGAKESATSYLGTWGSGAAAINVDTGFNRADVEHYLNAFRASGGYGIVEYSDFFWVDGQALTPDVFGFYKDGDGYVSVGSTQATDFRPGQWMPHAPSKIKKDINRKGGFGTNGFYLPMNDSSNPGADFHCSPNSIIKLKGEDLPQPRNGAPTTSDAFVSELRQETGTLGFDGIVAFDGSGDYLRVEHGDMAMGTGDFTVEAFIYNNSHVNYRNYIGTRESGQTNPAGWCIASNASGDLYVYSNGLYGNLTTRMVTKRWYHVVYTRASGTHRWIVDGVLQGTDTSSRDYTDDLLTIGANSYAGGEPVDGFISNVRVIKGSIPTEYQTSSTTAGTQIFTTPTEPLTAVTNTKLLCCNSSTSATASTITPATITANGNVFATRNELTGSIVLAVPGASTGLVVI